MPESLSTPRQVVLLHGLGRTRRSMRRVEQTLAARGHRVINISYKWRSGDVATLAGSVAAQLAGVGDDLPLDFVTHSLGSLVLRAAVAHGHLPLARVGRVVMLGPPNEGSEVADALAAGKVIGRMYAALVGPAGAELGTAERGIAVRLPPVEFELGVIAGNRSDNPVFSAILGGENDGRVRVDRTRVAGMVDFIVVPVGHRRLVVASTVLEQVAHFLEFGTFKRLP
jgi:triacylglycerol lipase